MSIGERKDILIQQIKEISNEQTLAMLEASLAFYSHTDGKDITDGLTEYQMQELTSLVNEPAEKDTISETEFKQLFARWSTK